MHHFNFFKREKNKDEEKQLLTSEGNVAKNIEKAQKSRNAYYAITGSGALLAVSSLAALFTTYHKDMDSLIPVHYLIFYCTFCVGMSIAGGGALTATAMEEKVQDLKSSQSTTHTKEEQETTQQTPKKDQSQEQQEVPNIYPQLTS